MNLLKPFVTLVFIGIAIHSQSQYYYSDIILTQQANATHLLLKSNKLKTIATTNAMDNTWDRDKIATTEEYNAKWDELKSTTTTGGTDKSITITYYTNDRVVKKVNDDKKNTSLIIEYEYDAQGLLLSIATASIDTSVDNWFQEEHLYSYDAKGSPTKMIKIKNNYDTTIVNFLKDEQGNIAEERLTKKGLLIDSYYYYYNDKKQLTDIVKFNSKVEKMLPEFLLEYNTENKLSQLTQIPFGSSSYLIWKYIYNANGLKRFDLCYNKKGELVGRITYEYK